MLRRNGLAEFLMENDARGYWRLERRLSPVHEQKLQKMNRMVTKRFMRKKEEAPTEGVDYWVMDIPQDKRHEEVLTYEVCY